MPRSGPLNGFFPYLRTQSAVAVANRQHGLTPSKGGGGLPPAGFRFLAQNSKALTLNGRTLMMGTSA